MTKQSFRAVGFGAAVIFGLATFALMSPGTFHNAVAAIASAVWGS